MRASYAATLLLMTGLFLVEDSRAQQPDRLGGVPDSLYAQRVLPQGAPAYAPDSAYAAALSAAEVDPGIWIFPDASVNAKMLQTKPPKHIDPKMIVPQQGKRNGTGER